MVSDLLPPETLLGMFHESQRLFGSARDERREGDDFEEWRGGLPPRSLLSTAGGPVQDAVYNSPAFGEQISEIVGTRVRPSSNRATYSYYCRPGDHLALHRDVVKCDVTVIIAISDNTTAEQKGGELVVYPGRESHPLSAVRADLTAGAVSLKLAPGETVVIAGGMVPHRVEPVPPGHYRIVAPMCFEAVG